VAAAECTTPRLNATRFERLIVDQIRQHILTESNMRDLVKMVNEEMDSVIRKQQERWLASARDPSVALRQSTMSASLVTTSRAHIRCFSFSVTSIPPKSIAS